MLLLLLELRLQRDRVARANRQEISMRILVGHRRKPLLLLLLLNLRGLNSGRDHMVRNRELRLAVFVHLLLLGVERLVHLKRHGVLLELRQAGE